MRLRLFISIIAAIVCFAVPASAFAQSLSDDVYSSQGNQVLAATGTGEAEPAGSSDGATVPAAVPAAASETAASGTLPFTGFQAGVVGLIGVALLGAGALLWRVNRAPHKSH